MAERSPDELAADLMFLLSQASHSLMTELTAGLAALGVSQRGYCILSKALAGDKTQGELAELAALDKTTMVVTVDELEKAGLAERRPSPTDRRARIVGVTPAGEKVVAKASKVVGGIYDDVLGALPAKQRAPFVDALVGLVTGRLSTPVEVERPVRRRAPRAKVLSN
jgi:DNA-binding MarR family transcriptional regulator